MSTQPEKKGGAVVDGNDHQLTLSHFHPKYWASWLGIGLMTLVWMIPRRIRDSLATTLADIYIKRDSNHKLYAQVNLALCFPDWTPEKRRELLQAHFRAFFRVILDAPLFWWGSDRMIRRRVIVSGRDEADTAIKNGESVVFLVSHSIGLDVCTTALAMDYKMQGFYKPFKNAVVDWLIFRMRSKRGGRLAARGEGFKTVIRDLKRGMTLFYLSDEDLGREGSVFVPFFGQQKATLAMLPRIVKISGARVFPVYTHYIPEKGQYQISILPELQDYPTGDPLLDARKLNEATEHTILIAPESYLWKLRLFKTREDGETRTIYRQVKSGELELQL